MTSGYHGVGASPSFKHGSLNSMPPRIVFSDEGSVKQFRFNALCPTGNGEVPCGYIKAVKAKGKVARRVVYYVRDVDVKEGFRRQGIATALYSAAAQEACSLRGHLASLGENRNPHAHSHDFWAKQAQKGRAIAVRTRSAKSGQAFFPTFIITDCPAPSLGGARRPRSRR